MKTILYLSFVTCIIAFAFITCEIPGDGCGPFKDRFKVTDFITEINKIAFLDTLNTEIQLLIMDSDTLRFDEFAITMHPVAEYYFSNKHSHIQNPFISTAYACSPVIPVSDEKIKDIRIFSDRDFTGEYAAGDNLVALFDFIVLYHTSGYHRYSPDEFLTGDRPVPDQLNLVLNTGPQSAGQFTFTVEYLQDGFVLDEYEFTTEEITIKME